MASEKPTSRREFLRGRAAARALLDKVYSLTETVTQALPESLGGPPAAERRPSAASAHLCASRRAMACEFAIEYHAADGAAAGDAALAALDLVEEIEAQLTIYRDASNVLTINRLAAAGPVEVEPRLFGLLELCASIHAETGGAFDITSGPLSRSWGFLKREGRLPAEAEIADAMAVVGLHHISLDAERSTIKLSRPGVEINFNAVGKGYALDHVAELLAERGMGDYLCHGGGSSVLARGRDRGGGWDGWSVGVPHPIERERTIGKIILHDEALGTSGAGTQFFEVQGRRFGHLIDPRTGWPAEGVYTATAVAATGAEADALSTAFYIMGPGGTAEYCAAHPQVGAVMVCPREAAPGAFDVHVFNLNDGRWIAARNS
jgi:thiamine biosynthesis lipoprotein